MSTLHHIPHLKPLSAPNEGARGRSLSQELQIRVGDVIDLYTEDGDMFRVRVEKNGQDEFLFGVVTAIHCDQSAVAYLNGIDVGDEVVVPRLCVAAVTRF